jgi:hypothetical protein
VGLFGFGESDGTYTSRAAYGFNLDWNAAKSFGNAPVALGLETGFIYSHPGGTSAGFFGSSTSGDSNANSNAFIVPLNIEMGYQPMDEWKLALLLGASGLYRSNTSAILVGRNDLNGGTSFDIFPSLGMKIGWAVSKGMAVSLRGDYIPTPGKDLFTTTLGAVFPLG